MKMRYELSCMTAHRSDVCGSVWILQARPPCSAISPADQMPVSARFGARAPIPARIRHSRHFAGTGP